MFQLGNDGNPSNTPHPSHPSHPSRRYAPIHLLPQGEKGESHLAAPAGEIEWIIPMPTVAPLDLEGHCVAAVFLGDVPH
ncbi:MAG: hypothetical protein E5X26_09905, partial [Mesorhizobium sp.]